MAEPEIPFIKWNLGRCAFGSIEGGLFIEVEESEESWSVYCRSDVPDGGWIASFGLCEDGSLDWLEYDPVSFQEYIVLTRKELKRAIMVLAADLEKDPCQKGTG
jgi:hypothetical protein